MFFERLIRLASLFSITEFEMNDFNRVLSCCQFDHFQYYWNWIKQIEQNRRRKNWWIIPDVQALGCVQTSISDDCVLYYDRIWFVFFFCVDNMERHQSSIYIYYPPSALLRMIIDCSSYKKRKKRKDERATNRKRLLSKEVKKKSEEKKEKYLFQHSLLRDPGCFSFFFFKRILFHSFSPSSSI